MGPTASGKTALAERLADRLDAVLVNADAFQVYRGFDIGTAKPERRERYEIIDILDAHESFGVGEWIERVTPILHRAYDTGQFVVIVGGTGLYIRALFDAYADLAGPPPPELREALRADFEREGVEAMFHRLQKLDPERARATDSRNPVRVQRALERAIAPSSKVKVEIPPFRKVKFALIPDLETQERRIKERYGAMLSAGFENEVQSILDRGVSLDAPAFRAIGYTEIAKTLRGELEREGAAELIIAETRRYAKRQRTWLRREKDLKVLDCNDTEAAYASAMLWIEGQNEDGKVD